MGLVNIELTSTIKNSSRSMVTVRGDLKPRNSITRTGAYNTKSARLEASAKPAGGDCGSQLKLPGINSRAKKPETA